MRGKKKTGSSSGTPVTEEDIFTCFEDGTDQDSVLRIINTKLNVLREVSEDVKSIKEKLTSFEELQLKVIHLERQLEDREGSIRDLTTRLNQLEQYSRNKNIEIVNVEKIDTDNVEEVVLAIGNKLGVKIEKSQIEAAHRLPRRGRGSAPEKIIVQFASRKTRDEFVLSKKVITNSDIFGQLGKGSRIYINENLTPYYQDILWKAKQFSKEFSFKFVWVQRGNVLMRKDENSREITKIKSVNDLHRLAGIINRVHTD